MIFLPTAHALQRWRRRVQPDSDWHEMISFIGDAEVYDSPSRLPKSFKRQFKWEIGKHYAYKDGVLFILAKLDETWAEYPIYVIVTVINDYTWIVPPKKVKKKRR